MNYLIERLRALSRLGAWFGGALIVIAAVVVGIEVVIRTAFDLSIGGADELSGFALAISSAWAFSYALVERAHVRIDTVYTLFGARVRACLDILGLFVFLLFMGLFAWQAGGVLMNTVAMDARTMTTLETPLTYPQFLWVAGLFFFVLVAVALLIRAAFTLARGDVVGVQRQIGSQTVRDEVVEEPNQMEQRGSR